MKWVNSGPVRCYIQFEGQTEAQSHLQMKGIEMNVQIETKLAFFTVGEKAN